MGIKIRQINTFCKIRVKWEKEVICWKWWPSKCFKNIMTINTFYSYRSFWLISFSYSYTFYMSLIKICSFSFFFLFFLKILHFFGEGEGLHVHLILTLRMISPIHTWGEAAGAWYEHGFTLVVDQSAVSATGAVHRGLVGGVRSGAHIQTVSRLVSTQKTQNKNQIPCHNFKSWPYKVQNLNKTLCGLILSYDVGNRDYTK